MLFVLFDVVLYWQKRTKRRRADVVAGARLTNGRHLRERRPLFILRAAEKNSDCLPRHQVERTSES